MDDVTNAARRTGSYIHDLAEEYEVQAKLEAACSKAYALTQQGLRRAGQTAVQLYHRLDVQQRLHRAEQVSMQAAANLDARWRLRQRAADWVQDFRRHWPVVSRAGKEGGEATGRGCLREKGLCRREGRTRRQGRRTWRWGSGEVAASGAVRRAWEWACLALPCVPAVLFCNCSVF